MTFIADRILITGGSGFIGSHLVELAARTGHVVLNFDARKPDIPGQHKLWCYGDIKDAGTLASAFVDFQPTRVIHLAAKANLNGKTVEDFPDNTQGTENVIRCVNDTASVAFFVNTSTQYVVTPGVYPADPCHLEPYTAYGESKAVAERAVRERCEKPWSIIRPTNIWGPRHPSFPLEMWRYLERRYYVHPGYQSIRKYYGYVGNAVRQILDIALSERPIEETGKVWYITDHAIDSSEWMNAFSLALSGKPVRRIPLALWRVMAITGDVIRSLGLRFPVNGDRLFRLTVNECLPDGLIAKLDTADTISLEEGVAKSVEWYRRHQAGAADSGSWT